MASVDLKSYKKNNYSEVIIFTMALYLEHHIVFHINLDLMQTNIYDGTTEQLLNYKFLSNLYMWAHPFDKTNVISSSILLDF